jgi:Meckel syndrome type 1 protein
MSMSFTSDNQPSPELPESDTPLFAANPIWERSAKKKRGFGGSRRTASTAAAVGPVTADPMTAPMTEREPLSSQTMSAAPYTRTTTTRKKDAGVPAVAIAAGVIVLGGLAAAGWYATQPHDNGVAQLTPGAPGAGALAPSTATTTTTLAANTPPPAAATAPAEAPKATKTTTTHTTPMAAATPRVRPAARAVAPSAAAAGVNASAALPDGPQPYSGAAAAPAPAAPATVQSIPVTPPVEPAPAVSASSPTTTTPATPAPEQATPPETAAEPQ